MKQYRVDIVVDIVAESPEAAWAIANAATVQSVDGVVFPLQHVSEPDEITDEEISKRP